MLTTKPFYHPTTCLTCLGSKPINEDDRVEERTMSKGSDYEGYFFFGYSYICIILKIIYG